MNYGDGAGPVTAGQAYEGQGIKDRGIGEGRWSAPMTILIAILVNLG